MYTTPNQIQINAKGSASSTFKKATFKASVLTLGATGPEAKEKAKPIIEGIRHILSENAGAASIDMNAMKTSFEVAPDTYHGGNGEYVMKGYKATYSIDFYCTNIAASLKLHDDLTNLAGVKAETPVFRLDDSASVAKAAFANAVQNAKQKFEDQCSALGLNPNHYEVSSWGIQDEQPRGKTISFNVDGAKPYGVGVEPGRAELDVTVQLVYVRTTVPT